MISMTNEHETNIVVVGLIEKNGKILVARRSNNKTMFPGKFELPGGHLDKNETFEAGLQREIKEELRLEVRVSDIVHAFTYTDNEGFKAEVCYLCYLEDPDSEPVLNPPDHSEVLWIGPDQIDRFEQETDETEAIRKAFKKLQQSAKTGEQS